jgi:hypothetical protein
MVLKLNLVLLQSDLNEIVETLQDVKVNATDSEIQKSVQGMSTELDRVFHAIVDPLTPFYEMLDNRDTFLHTFEGQFNNYVKLYGQDKEEVRERLKSRLEYHSRQVYVELEKIRKKDEWLKSIPQVKRKLEELEASSTKWIVTDAVVRNMMGEFYLDLGYGLKRVNDALHDDTLDDSFEAAWEILKTFLSESKPSFYNIIEHHNNMPYINETISIRQQT